MGGVAVSVSLCLSGVHLPPAGNSYHHATGFARLLLERITMNMGGRLPRTWRSLHAAWKFCVRSARYQGRCTPHLAPVERQGTLPEPDGAARQTRSC